MLLGFIIGCMVAGVFAALGLLALCAAGAGVKDCIITYRIYLRNKKLGNNFTWSQYDTDIKGIFVTIGGALFCFAIAALAIWSSYDWTQDHVLCDMKQGVLNKSNECVLETPL